MNTEYVVKTHQLCKKYGKQYAVDHIDMHVKKRRYLWFYW